MWKYITRFELIVIMARKEGVFVHKILVVDDQEGICRLLKSLFDIEGYITSVAKNGLEAIEAVKTDKPDLIIMDVKMPLLNGVEALKIIKGIYPDLPVVMMTAYAEVEDKIKARRLGIVEWMTKPLDINLLIKLAEEILMQKASTVKN